MTLPGGLLSGDVVAWYAARLDPGAADGAAVPTLPDVSGNGQDISQPTSSKRFTHRANHYGALSTWEANLDCYKKQWGSTINEPFTIFAVVELTGPLTTDYCIFSGYSKPQKHMTGITNNDDRWIMEQEGTGQHIYGGSPQPNTLYVLRAEYGSVDKLFANGVEVINGNAGNDASIGATIGCRENEQRHFPGFISEWGMAFGVGLTAVETDLRTIYGV